MLLSEFIIADTWIQENRRAWIELSGQIADPNFAFLILLIQGVAEIDVWLRFMERRIATEGQAIPITQSMDMKAAMIAMEKSLDEQRAHHVARLWIKEVFELTSIINKDRATRDRGWKSHLNGFLAQLNLIREPFAKLQTAGSKKLQFPGAIWYPTVPSLGWIVQDSVGREHVIMRTGISDELLSILKKKVEIDGSVIQQGGKNSG